MRALTAIHLACGGGGVTLGFVQAGVRTALAFDVDPVCIETHRANFPGDPVEVHDIRDVRASGLPAADVWTCGIPCEPYSVAGRKLAERDPRDISREVMRLIREAGDACQLPHYIFLENVPPFATSAGATAIREALTDYAIFEAILCHADYGIPQKRKRWHVVASLSSPAPIVEPTHCEFGPDLFGRQPWVRFETIRDGMGVKPVSARMLRGIFRRLINNAVRYGNAFQPAIVTKDDLLPTIMSSDYKGAGRSQGLLIYEDDGRLRPVSFVEARRGQGFPDDYTFAGTVEQRWGQVGRAVAPPVARAVANAIVAHRENYCVATAQTDV